MQSKSVAIEELMPVICEAIQNGSGVNMTPRGRSMLPFISEKDSVFLEKPPSRLKKYDIAFYLRRCPDSKDVYVMHRLIKIKDDGYVFCGDNQFREETGIEHSDIVALVTSVSLGDKNKMRGVSYAIYCRTLFLRRFIKKIRWKLGTVLKRFL